MGSNDIAGYLVNGGESEPLAEALRTAPTLEEFSLSSLDYAVPESGNASDAARMESIPADAEHEEMRGASRSDRGERKSSARPERETAPRIPQQVYDALPEPLRRCAAFFLPNHERDVFLTAALSIVAGATARALAKNIEGWRPLSLYTVIAATAGSGKGALRYARQLGEVIDQRLIAVSRHQRAEWQAQQTANAGSGSGRGTSRTGSDTPEEPPRRTLFLAGNSSARALADNLNMNGGYGIIAESEIVTLAAALSQDWGNFIDILLKAFHSETISIDRKDGESIRIQKPVLAMTISGTPASLRRLVPTTEDGLFSRLAIYTFSDEPEWRSQRPKESQPSHDTAIEQTARLLDDLHQQLERRADPLFVRWTEEQWALHDRAFAEEFKRMLAANQDMGLEASIKRSGVIAFRIGCILSVLRALAERNADLSELYSVTVDDRDAQIGITLAVIYFQHAQALAAEMPKTMGGRLNAKQAAFLNGLPKGVFSRSEYKAVAKDVGISERTGREYLDQFMRAGLVDDAGYARYRKVTFGHTPHEVVKTEGPDITADGYGPDRSLDDVPKGDEVPNGGDAPF